MKKKNRKFATTLLATALLSSGFTLKTAAQPQTEEQTPTEVCVTTEERTTQDLVATPKRKADSKTVPASPKNAPTSHGKTLQKQLSQLSADPLTDVTDQPPSEDILQKILNNTY